MDQMIIRKHNEHAQVAALHGIELPLKQAKREVEEFSQDQKDLMSKAIKRAVKRNMKEKLR